MVERPARCARGMTYSILGRGAWSSPPVCLFCRTNRSVWDYALDLKNFHAASHDALIYPVLIATEAKAADDTWQAPHSDGVRPPYRCGARHLRGVIDNALASSSGPDVDGEAWGRARISRHRRSSKLPGHSMPGIQSRRFLATMQAPGTFV